MTRSLVLDLPSVRGPTGADSPPGTSVRIAIVEPLLMLRELIARVFEQEFGCQVVAEAESGAQAMAVVIEARPHVVILDVPLPDTDGFSVVERIRDKSPASRILILSAYSDDYTVYRVEKANVHGFIDKQHSSVAELREAVKTLAAGGTYFSNEYEAVRKARQADPRSFDKILSESELKVLRLVAEGMTDEEIGRLLRISPRTARTHRHNILQKLKVAGTPKLIAFAMQHGFTTRNPPLHPSRGTRHSDATVAIRVAPGS